MYNDIHSLFFTTTYSSYSLHNGHKLNVCLLNTNTYIHCMLRMPTKNVGFKKNDTVSSMNYPPFTLETNETLVC
jgi:hypothetical protein